MVKFEMNPGILANMRFCLQAEAKMKNVKLKHPLEEYDMPTMLKMFKELESKPMHYTLNQRLSFLWDRVIRFFVNILMWIIRGFVSLLAHLGNARAKVGIVEIREIHNKSRNRKV